MDLKGSRTHENLKKAFAGESQANRRYLYFARIADIEGHADIGGLFRDIAEGETGHAHGHLEFLHKVGDPATDEPMGTTLENLKSAVAGETYEYDEMYPEMAATAREEGFEEIARWFETITRAERSHAGRFKKAIQSLD
jgi:rubrerythrin